MAGPDVKVSTQHPTLLPPKGMQIAFGLQVPLAILSWPWHPSLLQVLTGSLFLVAGSILNLWTHQLLTRHEVAVCPFGPVPRLVEAGPYRFSRNPMYFGMVLLVAGTSLFTGNPWNLWTALAYAIWLHRKFILPEEQFLGGRFGATYAAYCQGRGRWLLWF